MDFLGLDDLLAGTGLAPTPQPQQPPAPPPLQLRPQPQLSPQVFQQKWGALTNITKFQHSLSPSAMAFIEGNKHQVGRMLHGIMVHFCPEEAAVCCQRQPLVWYAQGPVNVLTRHKRNYIQNTLQSCMCK